MAQPQDMPQMAYRFLGRSGLQVSAISLGGWLTYGDHVDRESTFACMKAAYDCGVNFFDCAEAYANGQSEVVMGEAIRKFGWKRNDLVISTKIYFGTAFGDNPVNNKGLSRKHIIEGVDGCLKRLQLDYVDLIFAHRPDRQTPMEETVRAFNHIIDAGKAFYWGTSLWDADEIMHAWRCADRLGLIGPLMEQPIYNMLDREIVEKSLANLYKDPGLGLAVWSPLKHGILSGKYTNGLPQDSRFAQTSIDFVKGYWTYTTKEEWNEMVKQVDGLQPIADGLGIKMSTLALAWVLKNPNVSSAITGASSPDQVYENCRAIAAVDKLTPEIMEQIDAVFDNKPAEVIVRF